MLSKVGLSEFDQPTRERDVQPANCGIIGCSGSTVIVDDDDEFGVDVVVVEDEELDGGVGSKLSPVIVHE